MLIPLERLLIDAESILGRGRDLAALRRGILTVAAIPTVAATLLPAVLSEFCRAYPGISVRVRDDVAANFVDLVRSGDVDLGIGGQFPHDNTIFVQELFADPICLFAPADHPVARKRSISLREVVALDVIMPGRNLSVRSTLEISTAAAGSGGSADLRDEPLFDGRGDGECRARRVDPAAYRLDVLSVAQRSVRAARQSGDGTPHGHRHQGGPSAGAGSGTIPGDSQETDVALFRVARTVESDPALTASTVGVICQAVSPSRAGPRLQTPAATSSAISSGV